MNISNLLTVRVRNCRVDEMLKAASATADNVRVSPLDYDSALTPFATRHGIPIFNYYEKDSKRSIRFAKAMAGWAKCKSLPSLFHPLLQFVRHGAVMQAKLFGQ